MQQFIPIDQINEIFEQSPAMASLMALGCLLLIAALANLIVKQVLIRMLKKALRYTRYGNDEAIMKPKVLERLVNIVPALVIMSGIALVPHLPEYMITVVRNVTAAFIVLTIALALSEALNVINILYNRRADAMNRPIKGYIQVVKLLIALIALILIVASLIDKSPLILLSGLGAMAAVLMLVFQDTLLSLVASIQISSSDMVRVGDWIEMPHLNADGDVTDIALHTVKVQNWDKTITTLPTRRLISDPFKNWRGMQESGGRRIKRAIRLDQSSVHFLSDAEKEHLRKFKFLRDYLDGKDKELEEWNRGLEEKNRNSLNARRLTNIGTFRAYVGYYLKNHQGIHQEMTMIVRQLEPGATGIPIEIYCFTNTISWVPYEGIQSDIFDHLYAILPEFGLRAFQEPTGADMRAMGEAVMRNKSDS